MPTIGKNFRILLMEDDIDLGETLYEMLLDEGYEVLWVKDGIEASDISYEQKFELYIFDISVPKFNGLALLESLRNAEDKTTTIFISAMIDLDTIRKAFEIGAEDYIKKPFFPEELLLRIQAKYQQSLHKIYYKNLEYCPQSQTLFKDNKPLHLSKKQAQLFLLFIKNIDQTLLGEYLMESCSIKSLAALRVALNKLKQCTGIELRSIHGVGYRLETC